jgi:hypothetical protein
LLGRLQTERDKQRVLDGLESAAGGSSLDRAELDRLLSGLKSRVFLMQNVHDSGPELIESRWAMSYLSGPLTLQQIKSLTPGERPARSTSAALGTSVPAASQGATGARPVLPPQVPQVFLPLRRPSAKGLEYRPALLGLARVHFRDGKLGVDGSEDAALLAPLGDLTLDWQTGEAVEIAEADLEREAVGGAAFAALPPKATDPGSYEVWSRSFAEALYRTRVLKLWRSPSTKLVSRPGESEGEFRVRLAEAAREGRDSLKEAIRQRYGAKVDQLQQRLLRAQERIEREKNQANAQKMQAAISMGSTILGALFGRKKLSTSTLSRATTAARGVGRVLREGEDVDRAQDNAETLQQQIAELNAQMESEVRAREVQSDPRSETLEELSLKPKKADIEVRLVSLAWVPYTQVSGSGSEPAWA